MERENQQSVEKNGEKEKEMKRDKQEKRVKEMPHGWQQEFKNISLESENMIWRLENSAIQNILKV